MGFEQMKDPDFMPNLEIVPPGYEKNKDGIFKEIVKIDKITGAKTKTLAPLSHTPLTIIDKLCNPDTGEVSYNIEFDNKTVTVSGCDLSQKKGIMQLAGQGLLTTEKYARELSEYLIKTIAISPLPESQIYDRMGWKKIGFVLGQRLYTFNGVVPITLIGAEKQVKAIHSKGTLADWIKGINGLMVHDPQRFKMYIACVPPLLKPLGESNFSINDYGESGTGKTITTMGGMSMYGQPEELLFSGNTTQVGMERVATQFCDLPINLDDIQKVRKELLDSLVYMIGNGVGKVRGAKLGGLQEVLTWQTVGMFTGEIPIINDCTFMGMDARLIELYGGLNKIDTPAVRKFEQEVIKKANYGTFGPQLIEYIIMNLDEVISIHEESQLTFTKVIEDFKDDKETSGMANRLAKTFSVILTAGKIFEKLYGKVGGKEKDPEPIVKAVFKSVIEGSASETYAQKGLNHILSWIASNRSYFLQKGTRTIVCTKHEENGKEKATFYDQKYPVYGDITDLYYDILPSVLKTELEKKKLDSGRLIKEFALSGILETEPGRHTKQARFEGQKVKVYRFNRLKIDPMVMK